MSYKWLWTIKIVALCAAGVAMVLAGRDFYEHRHFKEPVVLGPGVTKVRKLSKYFSPLKGTTNDCNIYILDSGKPGSTIMVIGGTHPEEPGANLAAEILVENAKVDRGRLIVAIRANRSASTVTRPGDAYPRFYHISTDWGIKKFRMGDRWSNSLDSWPDPEVYVNYPSGQMLAYMDIRNLNRTWPGKSNGTITEQTCYAFIQLIKQEQVDVFIDLHEAELEYPVISTIVANQNAEEVAAMVSMTLTAAEFKRPIGMEFSPKTLHGLSHREVGDFTDALSLLCEAPEPFLDRVRGITDEHLLLTGKDPFVMEAGKHGLLYEKIDENGWPIDVRVGRHCSTILEIAKVWSDMHPDQVAAIGNVPRYAEVIENRVGHYFHNPADVPADQVIYE
ncbi:MAG: succinylglutamate desuccinylase [Candidatus Aerophobetes bacterium]|nr:succinylglutamate desuccinylase [Candidatus Aerophobetes bacterium]